MYQFDFLCTYKLIDDEYREQLYKIQLLQAFNLTEYNDHAITLIISDIFNNFNKNDKFRIIIESAFKSSSIKELYDIITSMDTTINDLGENKEKIIFSLMFNYDHFDLLHKCICELYINKDIKDQTLANLINKLLDINEGTITNQLTN